MEGKTIATDVIKGGCLCGAVGYRITAPYLRVAHCHCSRCRRATGAGYATNLYVPPDQFAWTAGQEFVVRHDLETANSFSTTFCRKCGAPLPHHTRSGHEIVVPAGSLGQLTGLEPQGHIFWDSRAAWTIVGDELPKFTGLWEGWSSGQAPGPTEHD